jgi:aminotransferase
VEAPVADTTHFTVRWSDIEPYLTTRTKAIVLCNPSNPTGAPVKPEDGRRIIAEAAARGLVVISDETYLHFLYEGTHWSAASVPAWRETVAVVGTFSKSFGMMGWRLGFFLADAAVCEQAVKVQDAMIICAPVIAQILGEAAVTAAWNHALTFHPALRARRQVLTEALATMPRVRWEPQAGGLFAFVRVEGCEDSAALAHRLLEDAHVVTIPGIAFGQSGEGCLRLSYGYATPEEIGEAMARIRALV